MGPIRQEEVMKKYAVVLMFMVLCSSVYAQKIHEMTEDAYSKVPATFSYIPPAIRNVAVLSIKVPEASGLDAAALREQFESLLVKSRQFTVIEREMLEKLLAEQKLAFSGMLDEAAMVTSGKLIGVQGFFTLNFSGDNDKIRLAVRLIDVQTGGLVYSETFTGESYSGVRFGLGAAYVSAPGIDAAMTVYKSSSETGYVFGSKDFGSISGQALSLVFTFNAGIPLMKKTRFGADLALNAYTLQDEYKPASVIVDPADYGATGNIENYAVEYAVGPGFSFSLEPRLFYKINTVISPYIGLGLWGTAVYLQYGGWYNYDTGSYEVGGKERLTSLLIQLAPLAGMEFNIGKALAFYVQGVYQFMQPAVAVDEYNGDNVTGWWFYSDISMLNGFTVQGGIKYYF
jgi:curli biogenesis system outer membrane secretion channel CsgG